MSTKKIEELKDVSLNLDLSPRATQATFRLHPSIGPDKARQLLEQCYRWVVADRGGRAVMDADTRRHIEQLAVWLTGGNGTQSGVMLRGSVGNGKTTLIFALQKLVGELSGYYGSFSHLGQYFRPGVLVLHSKDIVATCLDDKKEYRALMDRDMLAIDDLGAEAAEVEQYRNVMRPVQDLLEHRYQRRKFTMVSTNLAMKDLQKHYGLRVKDRMLEMFHPINFTNESYRGKNHGNGEQVGVL